MANASVKTATMVNPGDLRNTRMLKRRSCRNDLNERSARRFVALLFEALIAAELDAGAALGLGARKPGALEVVSTMLEMGAKFLVHLGVHLRTLEESGDAEAKRVEEFHTSSGCAARAEPMAVTSRFQLSVSSRRRLRPVAVSS